jgi:hypothetical protein
MKKQNQIQPNEIGTGVSLKESKKRMQETFDTVVKPQVEEEDKLSNEERKVTLTAEQKAQSDCLSPY